MGRGRWAGYNGPQVWWNGRRRYAFIAVYMMTNVLHEVRYTGVTSDLPRRAEQHRNGHSSGFAKRYRCRKLVYYREFETMGPALAFEHTVKGWSRARKDAGVSAMNPEWRDLAEEWWGPLTA